LRPGGRLVVSNPHPFATEVLGSRAWTTTDNRERVCLPEYPHRLGEYVTAFCAHGLVVTALREPTHSDHNELLAHEPAVVVWAAERI
jgi:hypothetical protein